VVADPPDKTREAIMAQIATDGILGNVNTLAMFGEPTLGELSVTDCVAVLGETAARLNDGDLSAAVTMLAAQAVALNAMFGELARVGKGNLFKSPDFAERNLRLAFKAQAQCRATLETLATIKNPPVVFARQANINHGGQQQVNNGPAPTASHASAHVGESVSRPNELLEDGPHGSPTLDTRATAGAGRTDQGLEAMGAVDRAAER
jgi:hypothetical protein